MARSIADRPRFTEIHDAAGFYLPPDSVYVSGRSHEERSLHVETLMNRCADSVYVEVEEGQPGALALHEGTKTHAVSLRSQNALSDFWLRQQGTPFLDITGLSHPSWAPLVRAGLSVRDDLRVVYVEPLRYRFNRIRTEGELFDLSTRFDGIGSLPGFLSLAEPDPSDVLLVPLLGFEGPRFSMIVNHEQAPGDQVLPIVGVPGFQPEFVYHAYHGNRLPLEETKSWISVRYAAANCPFSAFYALSDIIAENANRFLKVAPIGTKPHGLAAVLVALAYPGQVEIVYDHPVRRPGRTAGAARLLVYHLNPLSSQFAI